jgi:hypothetical protein
MQSVFGAASVAAAQAGARAGLIAEIKAALGD